MRISDWSSDVCSSDLPSDTNAVRIALTSQGVALAGSTHRLLSAYECINAYLNLHFPKSEQLQSFFDYLGRSEERRVGKSVSVRVDLGGRRIIKKKIKQEKQLR